MYIPSSVTIFQYVVVSNFWRKKKKMFVLKKEKILMFVIFETHCLIS